MSQPRRKPATPTETQTNKPQGPYGRVYMHYGTGDPIDPMVIANEDLEPAHLHCYMARIWNEKGVDIWHGKAFSAEDAYQAMRAAAVAMESPVTLYRNDSGAQPVEVTAGKDLPF